MTAANRIEMVRRGYAAYAERDFATIFVLFDPQIEITQTIDLPWGGAYRGLPEAQQFFQKISDAVEAQPEPETYFAAGDDVVAMGRLRGRARASGKPIDLSIVHVWTVRHGKIKKFAAYIDTPAMLEALQA